MDASCPLNLVSLFWNKSPEIINTVTKNVLAISVISNCDRVINVSDKQHPPGPIKITLLGPTFFLCIKKIVKEKDF